MPVCARVSILCVGGGVFKNSQQKTVFTNWETMNETLSFFKIISFTFSTFISMIFPLIQWPVKPRFLYAVRYLVVVYFLQRPPVSDTWGLRWQKLIELLIHFYVSLECTNDFFISNTWLSLVIVHSVLKKFFVYDHSCLILISCAFTMYIVSFFVKRGITYTWHKVMSTVHLM